MADCGVTVDVLAVVAPESAISVSLGVTGTERVAVSSIGAGNALAVASEADMKMGFHLQSSAKSGSVSLAMGAQTRSGRVGWVRIGNGVRRT